MNIRYNILFRLKLSASYYGEHDPHDHLMLEPTFECLKLFTKYRLLYKKMQDGIVVLYPTDTAPGSISARWPITQEEKFYFTIKVKQQEFWLYGDVSDWNANHLFFLQNPSYNTTDSEVTILNAPLTNPIKFFPDTFHYNVLLQDTSGLLEMLDSGGTVLLRKTVRAIVPPEITGKEEIITISHGHRREGIYHLRYINSAGTSTEEVFCSRSFSTDILAIMEMKYMSGPWTGSNPDQAYVISVPGKNVDWLYDIHIRKSTIGIDPGSLEITHVPSGEPPVSLIPVPGSIPVSNDFVQFKSTAPIAFSKKPIQLQLRSTSLNKVLIDTLPLPSASMLKLDGSGSLFTQIIVNV